MPESFFETLQGDSVIVVGGGEGLARAARRHFARVIAADPSRSLDAPPTPRQLKEGEVLFAAGRDATPDRLPRDNDCVILAFTLTASDQPVKQIEPWIDHLKNRGRLVVLEWAPANVKNVSHPSLHGELLATLEEKGRLHRPTSRDLTHWLQSAGLIHVRQTSEPSLSLFTGEDLAFMAADGLAHLTALGLGDSSLAVKLRKQKLDTVPVTVAHGIFKQPVAVPVHTAPQGVAAEEPAEGSNDLIKHGERSLVEVLASVLNDLSDDPADSARLLLQTFGSKALSALRDPKPIAEAGALSPAAAKRLVERLELGRRLYLQGPKNATEIHGPDDAYRLLGPQMASLTREHFRGLYLNVKGGIVADEVISIGTLTSALVHPREVYGPAIEGHCHSLLIAHNHPSGDPNPSSEDIHLTRELAEAGRLLGIQLVDHIVIGRNSYVSLKERGYF